MTDTPSPATLPSTISAADLAMLPVLTLTPGRHLQKHPGNACYLDPPGYPSYFTRSVYTARGDSPEHGPTLELFGRVLEPARARHQRRRPGRRPRPGRDHPIRL